MKCPDRLIETSSQCLPRNLHATELSAREALFQRERCISMSAVPDVETDERSTPSKGPGSLITGPTPDGRFGWAVLALALGGFGIGTGEFVMMGLLPHVAGNFGISIPTAGHVISAYALGVVVGAPLIAALGARTGRKRLLLGLIAVFVVGNVLSSVASSYEFLLAARFLSGLPHGAFFGIGAVV